MTRLTFMAACSNGRRREEDHSLLEQCQLPEDKQLGSKVMEEFTETASWMKDLGNDTSWLEAILLSQSLSL